MENENTIGGNDLVHCIYASSATVNFNKDDLDGLLAICRANNGKINISGMLLFQNRSFFQILEGEKSVVTNLYEKISGDKRHNKVVKIIQEPIQEKSFADWTMGYANISSQSFSKIDGVNDFFAQGKCFGELEEGRVRKLLQAFKDGQWRMSIS
jgi:hypothetical protein